MAAEPQPGTVAASEDRPFWRAFYTLVPHEHVLIVYMLYMLGGVVVAARTEDSLHLMVTMTAILLGFSATCAVARGVRQPNGLARAAYRVAPIVGIMLVYTQLRLLIPTIHPGLYDEPLYRIDLLVFRCEPALVIERFLTPFLVNWLSGWYSLYWVLLAVFVLPQVFLPVDQRRSMRLATAVLISTCIGQIVYTWVPGVGPVVAMADRFRGALPRGAAYDLMMSVATGAGPQRDIFPSLHTAHSLLFTMFCFQERASALYRWARWPMVLITVHIVIATMALRWHYAIDVVAGVALAVGSLRLSGALNTLWERQRTRLGLPPTWW